MLGKTRSTFRFIRRHWLTAGFVLGFITDLILLNRIDDLLDNLILLAYVLLATTSMFFLYLGVAERAPGGTSAFLKKYSPVLMQYAFGGLLSGMLIFYGRSGDWLASAPFFALILVVIVGNEFVGKRSDRLIYNLSLYFIGLFSYIVLVVPVIIGHMGDWVFIFSGFASLVVVTFVLKMLYRIIPVFMQHNTRRVIVTIGSIYIVFNALYFTNIIPPIPLSLTELEIVQSISRTDSGSYEIKSESQPWYRRLPFTRPELHPTEGSISCFARVFAPTRLEAEIYHRWEYKNEDGDWVEQFRFGYDISGVNSGGYGGYTTLKNYHSGTWRCSVESKRGQVLGRESFMIDTEGRPRMLELRYD